MNLANLLRRAARVAPESWAVAVGHEDRWRYGELATRVAGLAGSLRGRFGLRPGDRVALALRNSAQYLELLFATWQAGLTAVPINAKLHPREFEYILDHSGAKLCFASADLVAGVSSVATPDLSVLCVDEADYERLFGGPSFDVASGSGDEVAWLFYTSGTTGRPKGAMLTHRNLLTMTLGFFTDVDCIGADDCILHAAPMSHGSGQYILPHVAAMAKQVIPVSGGFDPSEMFELMARHPGLSCFAAPTMVRRLVDSPAARNADTRNLKTIVYGGGPMYVADLKRAMEVLGPKLAQIYGQGESPMTITAMTKARHADAAHPRYEQRLASVGIAQAAVEVRVADADDVSLPAGEPGEILVRGDTVMRGYWRDPEATARTLRNGWLHTGDVGAMDDDGFLTLMDRSKDLIISGGSNIYPREVEEVLLRHAAVAEVSVIGAPHPDWGEEVVAYIVGRDGRGIDAIELDRLCLEHIARFKRPKRYVFIEALPKNNYGKVLKTELRRIDAESGGAT